MMAVEKGVIVMGDAYDLKLWKAQKAWELAMRLIPEKPKSDGAWTEDNYLSKAQETIKRANEVVDAVFKVVG